MPAEVERCVKALLEKWEKDPSKRPPPTKEGQDAKSQAFAICNAAHKKGVQNSLDVMFEDGGYGPTLMGAAATNRPFIPRLEETKIIERDGKEWIKVHLGIPGYFNHPTGPFALNRQVFGNMIANLNADVVGQGLPYDARHKPELGALGWIEELEIDKRGWFYGWVDPTDVGLDEIRNRRYRYSSMTFHRNFKRDDVQLDLQQASEVDLLELQGAESAAGVAEVFAAMKEFVDQDEINIFVFGPAIEGENPPPYCGIKDGLIFTDRIGAKLILDAVSNTSVENEHTELYNPYHDEGGRFTTKERSASVAGTIGEGAKKIGSAGVKTAKAVAKYINNSWVLSTAVDLTILFVAYNVIAGVVEGLSGDVEYKPEWDDGDTQQVQPSGSIKDRWGESSMEDRVELAKGQDIRSALKKFLDSDSDVIVIKLNGDISKAQVPSFIKRDGNKLIITKKAARRLLGLPPEKKESGDKDDEVENELLNLFNKYHDDDGKFTNKQGDTTGKGGYTAKDAAKDVAKTMAVVAVTCIAWNAFIGAGMKGVKQRADEASARRAQGDFTYKGEEDMTELELEVVQLREKAVELEQLRSEVVALRLEAEQSKSEAIVQFAVSYRDKGGNGHPKQLVEFVKKLVNFGEFGENGNVVKLEREEMPEGIHSYLVAASRELIESIPGTVPAARLTASYSNESGSEDEFDFEKEWED